jgi:ATP-dependent DNA helicase UvrD/PcrA
MDDKAASNLPALIADKGQAFTQAQLNETKAKLQALPNDDRRAFRDQNAASIAKHQDPRLLIVAGPGTGKSYLFMQRIHEWISRHPAKSVYVTSFVRKLVKDLDNEINTSDLSPEERKLVTVTTLHGLARSLVERNGGTSTHRLAAHIQMIGGGWKDVVWGDVLGLNPKVTEPPLFKELERQFHDTAMESDEPWPTLQATYSQLSQFYNAVGFADSIAHATKAVQENPDLVQHSLWIVDEFQDFNKAEDGLFAICTVAADVVLLAGDDDQALYEGLKASHPEIIRGYRAGGKWTNAMLPYCGRCSYNIAMGADAFIEKTKSPTSIPKIFLPLVLDKEATPIQAVACSRPAMAVDYIESFINEHRADLEKRREDITSGTKKDSFLLILSHPKDVGSYLGKEQADRLQRLVEEWRLESAGQGEDYYRIKTYYRCAQTPTENFTLRKILHIEAVEISEVHKLIAEALRRGLGLSQLEHPAVAAILETCGRIQHIIDDPGFDAVAKTEEIRKVIRVEYPDRLVEDLKAAPLAGDASRSDEEEEEIETAGSVSPIELMSMVGAKGLSADHVVVLGFDDINMKKASPLAFFVAMTRARDSLHLLTTLAARGASEPHHYLDSIPEQHCQHSKHLKSGHVAVASRKEFVGFFEWIKKEKEKAKS